MVNKRMTMRKLRIYESARTVRVSMSHAYEPPPAALFRSQELQSQTVAAQLLPDRRRQWDVGHSFSRVLALSEWPLPRCEPRPAPALQTRPPRGKHQYAPVGEGQPAGLRLCLETGFCRKALTPGRGRRNLGLCKRRPIMPGLRLPLELRCVLPAVHQCADLARLTTSRSLARSFALSRRWWCRKLLLLYASWNLQKSPMPRRTA